MQRIEENVRDYGEWENWGKFGYMELGRETGEIH
jgi:hypothetical protein